MKVAITGSAGLFGHALVEVFGRRHTVFPLTRAEADITNANAIRVALEKIQPDVIVHAAAIADLDVCEADPDEAFLVNVGGTRHIVDAARDFGAAVAYISTDAVFDGKKRTPYSESDPANPPTVYGRTKLLAEQIVQSLAKHCVFRVSVLFGPGKTNFVEKGLRKIAAGEEYVVAADQVGSATYALDAAQTILQVIEANGSGLFHLANQGTCSRLELARHAAELARLDPNKVIGEPAEQMGRPAVRLKYAVMQMGALKRAGFALPRPWPEALAEYIRTMPFSPPVQATSSQG